MPGQALPLGDEREQLVAFLQQQRDGIRFAAFGLTDDQARLAPSTSTLSVGGLIKHVTDMERSWSAMVTPEPGDAGTDEAGYADSFRLGADETLASALDTYAEVCRRTDEIVRSHSLDHPVPVPQGVPWFPPDIDAWSVRWVILHLIEETARHAGHADIVRESIDGATMYELMAGAEGWPATDWLQPWSPDRAASARTEFSAEV